MAAGRALVAYADGPDGPLPDPARIEALIGRPVSVLLGWVVRVPEWLDPASGAITAAPAVSLMVGAGLRRAVAEGRVRPVPVRLSAIPGLLRGRLRPDVVVVGAVEDTSFPSGWRLVGSPGWAEVAVSAAGAVVIERWDGRGGGAVPAFGPELPPCRIVGVFDRERGMDRPPGVRSSPAHEAIGRMVASLIPDGATIQWGPGAIGAAVVSALQRPVTVRSGLVTDELADLADRGLLAAPAEAAYLWGGPALHAMVPAGDLVLREVGHTHDLSLLSAAPRFVAINAALEVGLDGAVNVETVGGRIVSGPGGHPDFAAGASRSPGGLSVVALPSTTGAGGGSSIVAAPGVVSTPRSDVDVVVTEHGVADLRGGTDAERAERMIAIAAPEHREELRAALGLVRGPRVSLT